MWRSSTTVIMEGLAYLKAQTQS
ncbi:rCG34280 [Rattus norvegicus]|uniref:RCG34280 n=1 Tax=Rattus norvegicus TaxID=10116 RepID=A6HDP0_RAT|nr:rCG34280 [Rattus norvegicus]